jgi:hypothetical protein
LLRIDAALPAGLFGHLFKLARASEVTAVVNHAAVPLIEGTAEAARAGYMPGGSRRNLEWVLPHTDTGGASEGTCCCSPTRRPPAGCWSPENCRGRR